MNSHNIKKPNAIIRAREDELRNANNNLCAKSRVQWLIKAADETKDYLYYALLILINEKKYETLK